MEQQHNIFAKPTVDVVMEATKERREDDYRNEMYLKEEVTKTLDNLYKRIEKRLDQLGDPRCREADWDKLIESMTKARLPLWWIQSERVRSTVTSPQ